MKGTTPNPYVGPRPFKSSDAGRFFGRERDTEALLATITAHQVTLLYAESGAGKTSLLQARVIPGLLDDGCDLLLRNKEKVSSRPPEYVPARVRPVIDLSTDLRPKNVFSLHALASILDDVPVSRLAGLTIASWRRDALAGQQESHRLPPPRVLIFDQFEEIFTTSVEMWLQRRAFFRDVAEALREDRRLRVVFAMREEYVANLDPFVNELPGNGRTRFRLERLRKVDALKAVIGPVSQTSVRFGHQAAKKIVSSLRGRKAPGDAASEYVEPLHLQVVCHQLWESLPNETDEISSSLIDVHADVEKSLEQYYEDCVTSVASQIGGSEAKIRGFFERYLITPEMSRGIVHSEDRTTGNLDTRVVDLIDQQFYLIRPEFRGSARWYELSHDRLVLPILSSNAKWRQSREGGEMVMALEQRARARSVADVLTLEELAKFDHWKTMPDAVDFEISPALNDWISSSRLVQERRKNERMVRTKRYMAGALMLAVLLVAMSAAALWLLRRTSSLEAQRMKAEADRRVREQNFKNSLVSAQRTARQAAAEQLRLARKDQETAFAIQRANDESIHAQESREQHFECLVRGAKENLPGKPAVALATGIRAYAEVKQKLPSYLDKVNDVLLQAVKADEVGSNSWRLRLPSGMKSVSISRDGSRVVTSSPREYCEWDLGQQSPPACHDSQWNVVATVSSGGGHVRVTPGNDFGFAAFGSSTSGSAGGAVEEIREWGTPEMFVAADKAEGRARLAEVAPDDSYFIWVGEGNVVLQDAAYPGIDPAGLELPKEDGEPVPADEISVVIADSADRMVIRTTKKAYVISVKKDQSFNTFGTLTPLPDFPSGVYNKVTLSANGRRVLVSSGERFSPHSVRVFDAETGAIYFDQTIAHFMDGEALLSRDGMKLVVVDNHPNGNQLMAWEYDISTDERGHAPPVTHVLLEVQAETAESNGTILIAHENHDEDGQFAIEMYDPTTRQLRHIADSMGVGIHAAISGAAVVNLLDGDAYVFDGKRRDRPEESPLRRACIRLCLQEEWNAVAEDCKQETGFDCAEKPRQKTASR